MFGRVAVGGVDGECAIERVEGALRRVVDPFQGQQLPDEPIDQRRNAVLWPFDAGLARRATSQIAQSGRQDDGASCLAHAASKELAGSEIPSDGDGRSVVDVRGLASTGAVPR